MTIICIFVEAFFADSLPFATQFCGVAFLISSIGASDWKDLEQVKIIQNKSLIVHLLPHKNKKTEGLPLLWCCYWDMVMLV